MSSSTTLPDTKNNNENNTYSQQHNSVSLNSFYIASLQKIEIPNRHWVPQEAKELLLSISTLDNNLDIRALAKFWSRPSVKQYTVGGIACSVCSASWFMASQYLKLGHVREARALALNGAFLHQCSVSIHILLAVLILFFTHIMCLHTPHASLSRTRQLKISSITVALISMHQFKIIMYPSSLLDIMPYGRQEQ